MNIINRRFNIFAIFHNRQRKKKNHVNCDYDILKGEIMCPNMLCVIRFHLNEFHTKSRVIYWHLRQLCHFKCAEINSCNSVKKILLFLMELNSMSINTRLDESVLFFFIQLLKIPILMQHNSLFANSKELNEHTSIFCVEYVWKFYCLKLISWHKTACPYNERPSC